MAFNNISLVQGPEIIPRFLPYENIIPLLNIIPSLGTPENGNFEGNFCPGEGGLGANANARGRKPRFEVSRGELRRAGNINCTCASRPSPTFHVDEQIREPL